MTSNNPHSNLPHINLKNHYQFVTFRTQESIDSYVHKIYHNPESDKIKQYKIDAYLDTSRNGAFLYGQIVAEIQSYFLSHDKKMYELIALSIMPNHVHILFKQIEEMRDIMRILKGGSSHIINQIRGIKGQVWAKDYFDKLVRNEKHFSQVYEYIKYNAVKANLEDANERFYGIYD